MTAHPSQQHSDESAYNPGGGTGTVVTKGQKFLRGYQITDDSGQVQFTTIYPGWYAGRTIHIHVRVRTFSGSTMLSEFTSQIFFDDSISNQVLAEAPYSSRSRRDTTNANDMVYLGASSPSPMLATLAPAGSGYTATITLGVTMTAAAAALPAIVSGGVASAASGAAGVAPGGWTSIFGANLASATRTMGSSDLVNGYMPTSLGGVSVQINGKPAYIYFVSPTQINVVAPADNGGGSVPVAVTNSTGTSNAAVASLQPILPGLFVQSNYVQAVRVSDGAAINNSTAARPRDTLELYGSGFGPTTTPVDAGLVFTGAYATSNPVSVTIGGAAANVSWAGLVGPGLYQINVTVPSGLASGDYPVVASIGGIMTQANALLKIAA